MAGEVGLRAARARRPSTSASPTPAIECHVPDGLLAEKVVVAGASHDTSGRRRHAVLRRRRLERDDLRHRQGRAAADLRADRATWPTRSCPRTFRPRCGRAPRSARWRSTSTRPVGGAATTNSTAFPHGIFPFGDAVVSFNPTFGQGMTMTAIQAGNLREVHRVRRRRHRAAHSRRRRRRRRARSG